MIGINTEDLRMVNKWGTPVVEDDDVKRIFLLNLNINKDEYGSIVSVTLIPERQAEAESFCATFLVELVCGNAGFYLTNNGIIFFNKEFLIQPVQKFFRLDKSEWRKLRKFLDVEKLTIRDMRPDGKFGIQISQCKD